MSKQSKKPPRPSRPQIPITPRRPDQYSTPDVTERHQTLIGLAVLNWSKLEHHMEEMIWALLAVEMDIGKIITTRLSTEMKFSLLSALSQKILPKQAWDEFYIVLGFIEIYKADRNSIIHGAWGTLMPENLPCCGSLKVAAAPGGYVVETFPESRMLDLINGMLEAIKGIGDMINLLTALPDRPIMQLPEEELSPDPSP